MQFLENDPAASPRMLADWRKALIIPASILGKSESIESDCSNRHPVATINKRISKDRARY